jgi:hypothetical protein
MMIVKSNGAQMCNRIWSYCPLIARSFYSGESIYIIDFEPYFDSFEDLGLYKNVRFIRNKYIKRLLNRASFKDRSCFETASKSRGINCLEGWSFRAEAQHSLKFHPEIYKVFRPKKLTTSKCDQFLSGIKESRVLVGLHIRRGDYKHFFNGAYYYDNSIFRRVAISLSAKISEQLGKETCFLLCSDEAIDVTDFNGINCIKIPDSSAMADLYGLSLCDYIISPPSTFSMWASYYGRVPLCIMKRPTDTPEICDFKRISAVDTFEDGSVFEHVPL